jgi:hypothetical protein
MQILQMTEQEHAKLITEVLAKMSTTRPVNGVLNLSLDLKHIFTELKDEAKPVIFFTAKAYLKMTRLIQACKEEIGWHGIVTKIAPNEYLISDILVFPQVVTGMSVNPDAKAYAEWLYSHDDETFNKIRFHGHSHVNMGVTPSGTDTKYRGDIIDQLTSDDFYIFMIINKRNDIELALYDFAANRMYEKTDCTIEVLLSDDKNDTINAFIDTAMTKVTSVTPITTQKKTEQTTTIIHAPTKDEKSGTKSYKLLYDDDMINDIYYEDWLAKQKANGWGGKI